MTIKTNHLQLETDVTLIVLETTLLGIATKKHIGIKQPFALETVETEFKLQMDLRRHAMMEII